MISAPLYFQLILLTVVVSYAILLFKTRLNPKVLRRSALIILAAGTALNMYGLNLEDFSEGIVTLFFRSMLLTIRMFVYDGDLIDLTNGQHTYMFLELYFCIFYLAMLTSISAIILLFGKRAMTFFSLTFRKKTFRHVFIGMNRRSEIIAKGIQNEDIAFIEFPSDTDDGEFSVKQIISGFTDDEEKRSLKSGGNILLLSAKRNLKPTNSTSNIFAQIGLEKFKKLITSDTAFYILSEDANRNLDDLMSLLSDKDLTKNTIHVCLSREGVARYYKTVTKRTGAHFIYPSSFAVVELMKNGSCHPAAVMQPAIAADGTPTGAVNGSFNALVVGFGETGQAATKFIYEFSAAVRPDGSPVPVHITVNDEKMDSLMGPFIFDNPEMNNPEIFSYQNVGTESSEFWSSLMQSLNDLNYIEISMGNDAANLELACTIFMYAMKKRRNGLDNLLILVRKRCTLSHEEELVSKMNERAGHNVIICYGEHEKVFTSDMIVSKKSNGINRNATSLADRISAAYTSVSGKEVNLDTKTESYHVKNRARMELHQLISRANHVASLAVFTDGHKEVSDEALGNLTRMEHLRYARYLAAHGYHFSDTDDDLFKTSHQICKWEELNEEDRTYHRDMVLAQLSIID